MVHILESWWQTPPDELLRHLGSRPEGLSSAEARARLTRDPIDPPLRNRRGLLLVHRQLLNPIVLLLLAAALVSLIAGERVEAVIILVIVVASALLSAAQEHRADSAMRELRATLAINADVVRDSVEIEVPLAQVTVGDIVILRSGDIVPADIRLLGADGLLVDEAAVTGEAVPVSKLIHADSPSLLPSTAVYLGTHVVSGSGRGVVVFTGSRTRFGAVAEAMERQDPKTPFEQSLTEFGLMLTRLVIGLVVLVVGVLLIRGVDALDGVLFALALAVGITPQLLPAIVALSLAVGARRMAAEGVLVKRLDAIEDLGGMTVLCCDKTGTLTTGDVSLATATDANGRDSARVRLLASVNARLQTGYPNAIDEAIRRDCADLPLPPLLDEVPYDFTRRVVSVLVDGAVPALITKGAVASVIDLCTLVRTADGLEVRALTGGEKAQAEALMEQGFRVLAVASRELPGSCRASPQDEREMVLEGFITIVDPAVPTAADAIARLRALGITLVLVTGDAAAVARHICMQCGMSSEHMLTGRDIRGMSEEELCAAMTGVEVVAEVDPLQKARVVAALRSTGSTVGFVGDGINDAVALAGADVGLAAVGARDVARHAASLVIMSKDLHTVVDSVLLGRRTFANTLKYVRVTISANFGNMISLALASTFLPFLPLLPVQVLLLNVLSDIPALSIAYDRVDSADVRHPMMWRMRSLVLFMVTFGLLSSVFDLAAFGFLVWGVRADEPQFQTTWFVLSTITECVALLVLRTWLPAWRSRPSTILALLSAVAAGTALLLPLMPGSRAVGLIPLSGTLLAATGVLAACYALLNEGAKAGWRLTHASRST